MGTPAVEPERVLAGRYRLERPLGKGGMGTIWRAEHLVLQAPVAVKLIDRDAMPDEETIGRFLREAKAAAALRSPHVVQILDYGMDEGVPFIVMELLEGENLSQRIRRLTRLSPADTARIVTHIGRAIGRAHEGNIIHRDLKPENVFLVHNEDEEIAKVLDFGVAKINHGKLGEGTQTRTGSILGTPYYMSPEQAQGNKAVDYRSDLWSLGVIAFECLTGKRPFYSDGLGDLVLQICVRDLPLPSEHGTVPPGFDAWFLRAVARDPEGRFQSAREMTDALREALGFDPRETQGSRDLAVASSGGRIRGPYSVRDADVNAPTVALEPDEVQRLAQSGVEESEDKPRSDRPESDRPESESPRHVVASSPKPEATVRRRTLDPVPPPHGHGMGMVVAVAAAALALGLAGGLVALRQMRTTGKLTLPWAQSEPALNEPTAKEPPEVLRRRVEVPPIPEPSRTADEPVAEEPIVTPSTSASVAPSETAAPSHEPKAPAVSATPKPKRDAAPADAGVAPSNAADGGWVKPAWAVPDEEPRRAPDLMQEETQR